jgi:hypothetical protein
MQAGRLLRCPIGVGSVRQQRRLDDGHANLLADGNADPGHGGALADHRQGLG